MGRSKCVPLKITAVLMDGRINSADGIIMFDSILYHAWFIKYAPHVLDGCGTDFDGYIGLPLMQLTGNRWAASKGIYEEIATSVENYNKRPDFFAADKFDYLDADKGIISDSAGKYRAYRNPSVIRTIKDRTVTFYAVGHKTKIEELLSLIPAIGKKPSMGWGFVEKWTVETIDTDYTTEHPDYGLMRPIEVAKSDKIYDYPVMMYGVKPPYWKPVNERLCYVPIRKEK